MELANHGLILLQQLNAQREFGFLCDCTVAIGDVFFKAHKAVLAAFSNYFRMLFIHQDSDCVRLKAADIQPDIFSYLLNLMYTGKLAPQLIDPARLEQGVRFLHAYPLLQEASQSVYSHPEQSINLSTSLYGIQISDQQVALSARLPTRRQLSSPFDVEQLSSEGKIPSTPAASASHSNSLLSKLASSTPDMEASTSEAKPTAEEGGMDLLNADGSSASTSILHVKPSIMKRSSSFRKHYSCHLCRSRFTQRSLLREHLLQHTQAMQQAAAEPSSALSPVMTAEQSMLDVEGILKGSKVGPGASASTTAVEIISDSEQTPVSGTNSDSPRAEVSTSSWGVGGLNSQADTPPPSDIADIDNLESADLDREVKRRKYECSTCGRKFIQKSHWREHMYIHTGKPFKCSACGKSFCRANQAARHVCLNQSADSYTMVDRQSMELCAAGDDGSQMEAMFLGSSKPYKCNICATTFSSPNEVIKHLCFTQGGLAALQGNNTGAGMMLQREEFSKDEGSDLSNSGTPLEPIKTEEILVE
ncbi:zinc finger and BTB domain-containing protein 2b [Cheilinus undulatus]|uniref:zinc finger and BTB domain-containing protein 2b n=1 Tax=Cheilinus undulatus TaxID=241271 RepID=UPI001BD28EE3|nr:zinc finger and BTB domain-containing protein 2b [Cheilinus undulatus]